MSDFTSEFYQFIRSGQKPVEDISDVAPKSISQFEDILEYIPQLSESEAKDLLKQCITLICTQEALLRQQFKPKF